jgi:hypothetical protein
VRVEQVLEQTGAHGPTVVTFGARKFKSFTPARIHLFVDTSRSRYHRGG